MKWRCPQCGRPHAANDPPCTDCGHGRFERAVVAASVESEGQSFRWVCPDCGKTQPKNTPPCSRCGGMSFERRSLDYEEEFDTDHPGRFEGLLPVLGVLAVVVVAFGLLATGVVSLPGSGQPTVVDPPGAADSAEGLDFAAVEEEAIASLNAEREATGRSALATDDALTDVATFWNQRTATGDYEGGSVDGSVEEFETTCSREPTLYSPYTSERTTGTVTDYDTAGELAAALTEPLRSGPSGRSVLFDANERIGMDVHAGPDGLVYVTIVLC